MNIKKIETAPLNTRILLYWEDSKHFEDGTIYLLEDTNTTYHVLFDGESLNTSPTHWCELPLFNKSGESASEHGQAKKGYSAD